MNITSKTDCSKLDEQIDRARCLSKNGYVYIVMDAWTASRVGKYVAIHGSRRIPNIDTIMMYRACRVFIDDKLKFGEVRILIEIE